jgi:hypothetical protein
VNVKLMTQGKIYLQACFMSRYYTARTAPLAGSITTYNQA